MIDAAGLVGRTEPFGYDALAAQRAGAPVNALAIHRKVLVESDACMTASQQAFERSLARLNRLATQILSAGRRSGKRAAQRHAPPQDGPNRTQ